MSSSSPGSPSLQRSRKAVAQAEEEEEEEEEEEAEEEMRFHFWDHHPCLLRLRLGRRIAGLT